MAAAWGGKAATAGLKLMFSPLPPLPPSLPQPALPSPHSGLASPPAVWRAGHLFYGAGHRQPRARLQELSRAALLPRPLHLRHAAASGPGPALWWVARVLRVAAAGGALAACRAFGGDRTRATLRSFCPCAARPEFCHMDPPTQLQAACCTGLWVSIRLRQPSFFSAVWSSARVREGGAVTAAAAAAAGGALLFEPLSVECAACTCIF